MRMRCQIMKKKKTFSRRFDSQSVNINLEKNKTLSLKIENFRKDLISKNEFFYMGTKMLNQIIVKRSPLEIRET